MPGHSVPLQALGTFTLWFGWFGFNCGSAVTYKTADMFYAASYALVNTTLSGAMAAITALFTRLITSDRRTGEATFDVDATLNASLGGSVAITAGAGIYHPWCAVFIGFFAGLIYLAGSEFLVKKKIDDVVDAIPVHCFNGLWGMTAVGLFAAPDLFEKVYGHSNNVGLFYEWSRGTNSWALLGSQIIAIMFIITWVTLIMFPFFFTLRYMGYYRSDALEEFVGLDASYHGRSPFEDDPLTQEYYEEYRKRKDRRRNRGCNASENGETEDENQVEQAYDTEGAIPEEARGLPYEVEGVPEEAGGSLMEGEIEEGQSEVRHRHPVVVDGPTMVDGHHVSPFED